MTEPHVTEWEKELKVLLDRIEHHPSQDLTEERDRVVVLNRLIAAQRSKAEA